jgi:hypothetical protein
LGLVIRIHTHKGFFYEKAHRSVRLFRRDVISIGVTAAILLAAVTELVGTRVCAE